MRRGRNNQVTLIILLVVIIAGMSVGFAAFSRSLTISSSASVKPNESDFGVTVYGTELTSEEITNFEGTADELYNSTTKTTFWDYSNIVNGTKKIPSATNASITNNGSNFSINNINVTFDTQEQTALYPLIIKNTGKYDVYFNKNETRYSQGSTANCKQTEGGNQVGNKELESLCKNMVVVIEPQNNQEFIKTYKLVPGESVEFYILIVPVIEYYSSDQPTALGDGDYEVIFDPIVINYSSVPYN